MQWWSQSNLEIFTDSEHDYRQIGNEPFLAVANHHYDVDWMFMAIFVQRFGLMGVMLQILPSIIYY